MLLNTTPNTVDDLSADPAAAEDDDPSSPASRPEPDPAILLVPVGAVRDADSPRSTGVDIAHARSLAELEVELPPIILHRPTMRVIDGMHRLTAARLNGLGEIRARFFDGTEDEAFLLAVRLNVAHGMPLPIKDRRAAAARILHTHPSLSDRSIARTAGLAAKTVGALRRRLGIEPTEARMGRDGRVRPMNSAAGRQAAADLIAAHPDATLRQIARDAGISVETARNVRERIRAGQDPVLDRRTQSGRLAAPPARQVAVRLPEADPSPELRSLLETIRRDPALRYTESGRTILRWLSPRVLMPDEIPASFRQMPPHCRLNVGALARSCAAAWIQLALELEP